MIPVIGVGVVNGVHWVERLIRSIDYPTKEFVIFNNNGKDEITKELEELTTIQHQYIKRIRVCHLPSNIGCSGAWNLTIKSYMLEPYWILSTHDIAFLPGTLEKFVIKASDPEVGMVHMQEGDFRGSFECFLIKDWVVQNYGLFDENFYPAYVEDCDYLMRVDGRIKREYLTDPFWHGETMSYAQSGSQTWRSDLSLKNKIDNGRILNEVPYMVNKWGGDWRNWNRYDTPYNNPFYSLGYSNYDLFFNRMKHLGF